MVITGLHQRSPQVFFPLICRKKGRKGGREGEREGGKEGRERKDGMKERKKEERKEKEWKAGPRKRGHPVPCSPSRRQPDPRMLITETAVAKYLATKPRRQRWKRLNQVT